MPPTAIKVDSEARFTTDLTKGTAEQRTRFRLCEVKVMVLSRCQQDEALGFCLCLRREADDPVVAGSEMLPRAPSRSRRVDERGAEFLSLALEANVDDAPSAVV